jgi:hypothetical protein
MGYKLPRLDDEDPNQSTNRDTLGLSKIDVELARFHLLLEKKYATDHDGTYSYIDPATGTAITLTPFMMKEWAQALVSYVLHPFGAYIDAYTSMMASLR